MMRTGIPLSRDPSPIVKHPSCHVAALLGEGERILLENPGRCWAFGFYCGYARSKSGFLVYENAAIRGGGCHACKG
jgi:hypothetical protein